MHSTPLLKALIQIIVKLIFFCLQHTYFITLRDVLMRLRFSFLGIVVSRAHSLAKKKHNC